MSKFKIFLDKVKTFFKNVKSKMQDGYKWLGNDGIINMESSALLMIVLMLFFPIFWSAIITFLIVIGKCVLDKSRGHENEKHDLICAIIGILFGVMLGSAHAVIALI